MVKNTFQTMITQFNELDIGIKNLKSKKKEMTIQQIRTQLKNVHLEVLDLCNQAQMSLNLCFQAVTVTSSRGSHGLLWSPYDKGVPHTISEPPNKKSVRFADEPEPHATTRN